MIKDTVYGTTYFFGEREESALLGDELGSTVNSKAINISNVMEQLYK